MAKGLQGGIWLELKKQPASDRPIEVMPAPRMIYLPLMQHIGEPCVLKVEAGDYVRLGQPVAEAGPGISCRLHSPVSGEVEEITSYDSPTGGRCHMIVIENDGRDHVFEHKKNSDTAGLSQHEIIAIVKDAAISSVSGLDIPLWAKLEAMAASRINTLIINAVETEPYICTSQKLISESPDEVVKGLELLMRGTGARKAILAVSDDIDDETVGGMLDAARLQGLELRLTRVHQKYPSGNEKYLSVLISGDRHIVRPEDMDAGFVYAEECVDTSRAALYGFPQISRVVTVAGDAVGNPQNVEVRIGTPVRAVLDHCGLIYDPERVVLGSSMRGVAITNLSAPVTKQVTAVLALVPKTHEKLKPLCINCGKCVGVCPEGLMPNYIAMRAVMADIEACLALHIEDCIECGSCAYICPGRMPIVELIKNIKKAAALGGGGLE
jgi:electron transport complex protein RnfC